MMSSVVFLVFIALFVLFLFGVFSIAEGRSNPTSRLMEWRWRRSVPEQHLTQAAVLAMKRAGYQGDWTYVQLTDVGLLAYRHLDEPKLVRYGDVVLDTRFLRPFVELWLPYAVTGGVRFELIDSDGRLRYADETQYDLQRGKNTLLPGTWLPLEGKTVHPGRWMLRVLAGDTLLGVHMFGWQEVGGGDIQRYVEGDGEISPALQQALQSGPREAVSLADLLADQENWN